MEICFTDRSGIISCMDRGGWGCSGREVGWGAEMQENGSGLSSIRGGGGGGGPQMHVYRWQVGRGSRG